MSTYLIARTVFYGPTGGRLRKWQVRNQVVGIIDGGECLTPAQFPVPGPDGDRVVTVACGRRVPSTQQCDACRVVVEVVEEHRVVLDAQGRPTEPVAVPAEPERSRVPAGVA